MPPIGGVSMGGLVGLPPHLEMTGILMKRVYGNHGSWSTPARIWKYCWFPGLIQLCLPKNPCKHNIEFGRPSAVAIYIAATVCQYQECEIRNLEVEGHKSARKPSQPTLHGSYCKPLPKKPSSAVSLSSPLVFHIRMPPETSWHVFWRFSIGIPEL